MGGACSCDRIGGTAAWSLTCGPARSHHQIELELAKLHDKAIGESWRLGPRWPPTPATFLSPQAPGGRRSGAEAEAVHQVCRMSSSPVLRAPFCHRQQRSLEAARNRARPRHPTPQPPPAGCASPVRQAFARSVVTESEGICGAGG